MNLGEKLLKYRKDNKIKQKELSEKLKIPQCVISKIEHGKVVGEETRINIEKRLEEMIVDKKAVMFLEKLAKEDEEIMQDTSIKPNYYKLNIKGHEIEVMDIIEVVTKDLTGIEAFAIGNILKYVIRANNKNGLEDLKKAEEYLHNLIIKIVE